MRRILLLQPTVGEWDEMRTKPSAPLALVHAATLIAEEYDVRIFDRRLHGDDWRDILRAELTEKPLLVGATGFTGPMLMSCIEMCEVVRQVWPEVPIVWGGIHASLLPHETARSGYADFVIQGEGEIPLLQLAQALDQGLATDNIPAVWCEVDGQIKGLPPGKWAELDDLPDPPWRLIDVEAYLPEYKGRRSFYYQSSRGCPLQCTYCYNVNFNSRRWRKLSAEKTVSQVQYLIDNYNVEDIYFVDDMFFTDIRRGRAIAEALLPMDITWQVQGVDIRGLKRMSDEDFQLIHDSGCQRLTVGIESGSPRIRDYVKKDGTVEDIIEVTERLARFPINLYYSFMCGIPGETREDLQQSVDLALRLLKINPNVHISPFYIFTPYPGTDLFRVAQEQGLETPTSLEQWARFRHEEVNLFPEKRHFYESLYFTSLFLDRKANDYTVPAWVRILSDIYRPVARFRTKNFFFHGLLERHAMNWLLDFWQDVGRNMKMKKPLAAQ